MRCLRDTFGASTTNTPADNTDAFLNAAAAGPFSIPDETYICDEIVLTEARHNIQGEGWSSRIKTPKLTINVAATNFGSFLRDFRLSPLDGPADSHGLEIKQTAEAGAFFDFDIGGLFIDEFGKQGVFFNNDIASTDAFFNGNIHDNRIGNGVKGSSLGDGLTVARNTISGGNLLGWTSTHLPGARCFVFRENRLVTRGGGFRIQGAEQAQIVWNHIEHPSHLGNYTGGALDAMAYMQDCFYTVMEHNRVSAQHGINTCVGAGYDIVNGGANWATNTVLANLVGVSRYSNRVVNGTGAPIAGNIYN